MLIFQTICSPWNNTQKERKKRGWFFFGMKRNENDIAIIGPTASLYEKNVWAIEWGRNRGKERDSTIDGESVLNVFFFLFFAFVHYSFANARIHDDIQQQQMQTKHTTKMSVYIRYRYSTNICTCVPTSLFLMCILRLCMFGVLFCFREKLISQMSRIWCFCFFISLPLSPIISIWAT